MRVETVWVPMDELTCGCVPTATGIGACPTHFRAEQLRLALVKSLLYLPEESLARLGVEKLLALTDVSRDG